MLPFSYGKDFKRLVFQSTADGRLHFHFKKEEYYAVMTMKNSLLFKFDFNRVDFDAD